LCQSHHLLTATFSLTFLRPVSQGVFRAEGTSSYKSSRLVVSESKAFDYKNRLVAIGSGTLMPSQLPLDEKVGYRL
jgi:acyl-coenzyme A thioesterase PaaI-like protein